MNAHTKRFMTYVGATALLSSVLQFRLANAQCYFDPFTGRKICTPPNYGWQSPQDLSSNPQSDIRNPQFLDSTAHCRITVGDGSVGSGVLVSRDDATGLVLTCSHLFDDAAGRIIVAFPNGKRFAARLLDRDQGHDLAALAIRRPDMEPLPVSQAPPASTLAACGFGPNGQFRCVRGGIIGQATAVGAVYPSLTIEGAVRPGDSGGGVLNAAGQLVGIVWGQRDGLTYATCGQPVRDFLKRVLGRARDTAIAQRPATDTPATSPQIDWQAWSTEIERRIESLDDRKQDKGDYLQPGDLNGYLRASDAPKLDQTQFARRDEFESRLQSFLARLTTVHSRFESLEERIKNVATGRAGVFEGLSFGKLLVATLGLSGPLAAAAVLASGLAGRGIKKRGAKSKEHGAQGPLSAPCSPLPAPQPIAVDTPPPPQRTVPETHYVPYEKDSFAKAHQWASEQVARKYPGATELLQAQDSLIKQYIAAH